MDAYVKVGSGGLTAGGWLDSKLPCDDLAAHRDEVDSIARSSNDAAILANAAIAGAHIVGPVPGRSCTGPARFACPTIRAQIYMSSY